MTKQDLIEWKAFLDVNEHLEDNFGLCCKLYNMTTENLLEFVNKVECKDKNVLTVTGSGDQAFNVILNGAKNITCFDINPLSFCQLNLKRAAITTLSFDEFCKFFYITHSINDDFSFFDKKLFDKFAGKLDNDTFDVFNYIYDFYNGNTKYIARDIYFYFYYEIETMKNMSNYLNPTDYKKLAYILNNSDINIDFIESDFKNLSNKIGDKKFDLIMLSNISDYIHLMYRESPLQGFYNDVMKLTDNLNTFGTIEVGYVYSNEFFKENHVKIDSDDSFGSSIRREKVFTTDKFHTRLVSAYDNFLGNESDKIITYQKFK